MRREKDKAHNAKVDEMIQTFKETHRFKKLAEDLKKVKADLKVIGYTRLINLYKLLKKRKKLIKNIDMLNNVVASLETLKKSWW